MKMLTTLQLITDEEIVRVHAYADFGPLPMREVVDQGVLHVAFDSHTGGTQFAILRDHGLVSGSGHPTRAKLTKKGYRYLRAVFANVTFAEILALRQVNNPTAEIKRLREALENIGELNKLPPDENGHCWDNSDLIGQEITFARVPLKGGDA